jgi:hypothetical protein
MDVSQVQGQSPLKKSGISKKNRCCVPPPAPVRVFTVTSKRDFGNRISVSALGVLKV